MWQGCVSCFMPISTVAIEYSLDRSPNIARLLKSVFSLNEPYMLLEAS